MIRLSLITWQSKTLAQKPQGPNPLFKPSCWVFHGTIAWKKQLFFCPFRCSFVIQLSIGENPGCHFNLALFLIYFLEMNVWSRIKMYSILPNKVIFSGHFSVFHDATRIIKNREDILFNSTFLKNKTGIDQFQDCCKTCAFTA